MQHREWKKATRKVSKLDDFNIYSFKSKVSKLNLPYCVV
jgi:hypothetical protein